MTHKPPERDLEHLRHALRCAARVAALVAVGKTAFFADVDKVDALCWNMYQLADVTGKLSDAVREKHPEIPWRQIAGFRNFTAHAYEGIDPERMWNDIGRGDVADLAEKLDAIYQELVSAPPAGSSGEKTTDQDP